MSWFDGFFDAFLRFLADQVVRGVPGELIAVALRPMVRTPGPNGPPRTWIAFANAVNPPWPSLLQNVYWQFTAPLTFGLLSLAMLLVGLRVGAVSAYRWKKMFRRIWIAFFAIFFWIPIASAITRLFDAIGYVITTGGTSTDVAAALTAELSLAFDSASLTLFVGGMEILLILLALVWLLVRWMAIIVLTLGMPLVAVFWVLEVWPLRAFSGIAARAGGVYVGLIVSALPAAFYVRVILEASTLGFDGVAGSLAVATVVPFAAITQIVVTRWASRSVLDLTDRIQRKELGLTQEDRKVEESRIVENAQRIHRQLLERK